MCVYIQPQSRNLIITTSTLKMSLPDSRQIISLVSKYANEGNEFLLNNIVCFLTMNFDRTRTAHPHNLPLEEKRTWLLEHDIFAIVKFRYVIKCVVVLYFLLTYSFSLTDKVTLDQSCTISL